MIIISLYIILFRYYLYYKLYTQLIDNIGTINGLRK